VTRKPPVDKSRIAAASSDLYLGLVVLPQPGQLALAQAALRDAGDIEVAPAEGHRIPAFAKVAVGEDEALLEKIRRTPHVLGVDVAFAELVSEESP
jgi:hypothetical protein